MLEKMGEAEGQWMLEQFISKMNWIPLPPEVLK